MELGLTIPLQRHLKIKTIFYGEESLKQTDDAAS